MRHRAAAATIEPLSILVVAPLPYRCDGRVTFSFGGSVFFAQLLPRLALLGHRVRVIAEAPAARDGEVRAGLDWHVPGLTVEWFACEYRSGSTPPAWSHRQAQHCVQPLFARLIEDERPDVVLVGREGLTAIVPDLCAQWRLRSLLIAHGSPTAALLGGIYPPAARRRLVKRFLQADVVVTVSAHLEQIMRQCGVRAVRTISNVVDPLLFRPRPRDPSLARALAIGANDLVVTSLSALKPGKRPLDIVAAAPLVLGAQPNVVYVIVGDGPSRGAMERAVRRMGIAARFRFAGEIEHRDAPRYLNLSDIVVSASEREGFGFANREAQACGRALLASDIPATRELVVDGKTGMLFRLGDVHDLAAKTRALADQPALRRRLGRQARRAAARATPERWVQAYEKVLRDVAREDR